MSDDGKGWTLVARFSNSDHKRWIWDSGSFWYSREVALGTTTSPSVNADMISHAFWLVSGRELKITRSDDPSHSPLLQTTGNGLAKEPFRSKITIYGHFRNGTVWAVTSAWETALSNMAVSTSQQTGFNRQAECSGDIQSATTSASGVTGRIVMEQ